MSVLATSKAIESENILFNEDNPTEANFESLCTTVSMYSTSGVHVAFDSVANSGSFFLSSDSYFDFEETMFTRVSAIGSTNWATQYEANELPTAATPAWVKTGSATTEEISPAGFLHLVSKATDEITYFIEDVSLDNSVGVTLEARVKMVSGYTFADGSDAMSLVGRDGVRGWFLDIYSDTIDTGFGQYSMDTTDDFHTYRVTVIGTTQKVYVDGVLVITATLVGGGSGDTKIFFKGGYFSGAVIESSWDYVYYRADGAFAPSGTLYLLARR